MTSASQMLEEQQQEKTRGIAITIPKRLISAVDDHVEKLKNTGYPTMSRSAVIATAIDYYLANFNEDDG